MKKLSELSDEIMLCVESRYDGDIEVMSKKDFLDSSYYLDFPAEPFPKVTIGDRSTKQFDLQHIIYEMSDEMYEDWDEDVWGELKATLNVVELEATINAVLDRYPTYFEGEEVAIDIVPEKEVE